MNKTKKEVFNIRVDSAFEKMLMEILKKYPELDNKSDVVRYAVLKLYREIKA